MRLFLGVGCAVVASHEFDASMDVELRAKGRAWGREPKDQSRNQKTSSILILRGSMSALSFPKLPGAM
jgi:hypothetical protein